jgi:hypothetical protein
MYIEGLSFGLLKDAGVGSKSESDLAGFLLIQTLNPKHVASGDSKECPTGAHDHGVRGFADSCARDPQPYVRHC